MTNETTTEKFAIIVSAAPMPGNCWGRYCRIGVIAYTGETPPRQIRATRSARVVRTWERLHCGKTGRSADARAMAEARALVASLEAVSA
jgi:hypothetical protein